MRQLRLHRASLEADAPTYPAGYIFRRFAEADADGLRQVLEACFEESDWGDANLGPQTFAHPKGIGCFVVASPRGIAATVTGLVWPDAPHEGYVHYIGVHPDHRGLHLGRLALLSLFQQFRSHGLSESILDTDDWRLPAIRTYLNLGYVPRIVEEGQEGRWAAVMDALSTT
ncbi:MAG: GNAT family N-acetyltransferase [Armatimonadetes bacterium]|nr:GNAT family N-acetyltransferase [Armatimonadota bacterium]